MIYGIDTATRITPVVAKKLKENGISFVGRYLVPPSLWKAISPEEIKNLLNNDLAILLCWEIDAADISGGTNVGVQHAMKAKSLAEAYGVPSGTAIYFACDYNAQPQDYKDIEDYLKAAKDIFAGKYEVGLYGHNRICDHIANMGIARYFWQCKAWSSGVISPNANIYQYQASGEKDAKELEKIIGISIDLDDAADIKSAKLWMPPSKKEKHWYDDAMAWVKEEGLMMDGRPNDNITRAEVAMMFYRRFGPEDTKDLSGMIADD